MKTCPFCAEEIQDAAIKCKHCGEKLASEPTIQPQPVEAKEMQLARAGASLGGFLFCYGAFSAWNANEASSNLQAVGLHSSSLISSMLERGTMWMLLGFVLLSVFGYAMRNPQAIGSKVGENTLLTSVQAKEPSPQPQFSGPTAKYIGIALVVAGPMLILKAMMLPNWMDVFGIILNPKGQFMVGIGMLCAGGFAIAKGESNPKSRDTGGN